MCLKDIDGPFKHISDMIYDLFCTAWSAQTKYLDCLDFCWVNAAVTATAALTLLQMLIDVWGEFYPET